MSYAKLQRPKSQTQKPSGPTSSRTRRGHKITDSIANGAFGLHGIQPEKPLRSVTNSLPGLIQAKLKVGSPRDPAEHEADLVASEVVRRADRLGGASSPVPPVGNEPTCANCQSNFGPEINIRRLPRSVGVAIPPPEAFHQQLQRERIIGGSLLDARLRSSLEAGFGSDLSSARVHRGTHAADLARQINARAFTVGRDIFFDHGEYQPASVSGRTLIAHELTHVIQQGQARDAPIQRTCAGCSSEQEELLQRSPRGNGASCTQDPEEQGELDRALRFRRLLERWLHKRVDAKELKVGRLRKLRARRARRLCLLDTCGMLESRLSSEQLARLRAFDDATEAGAAVGACDSPTTPNPSPNTPPPKAEEAETKFCPAYIGPPARSGKKLWVLAKYPNPWSGDESEEADAASMQDDSWAPSTVDFRAAAGSSNANVVSTPKEVIAIIKKEGENGIAELNIVGHGNEDILGLSGTISVPKEGPVSVSISSGLRSHSFSEASTGEERLERYFAQGAVVNLYACNAGLTQTLPRGLARSICRLVRAPKSTIYYCPDTEDNTVRNRQKVYIEGSTRGVERNCKDDRTEGFTSLQPFMKDFTPDVKKIEKLDPDAEIDVRDL